MSSQRFNSEELFRNPRSGLIPGAPIGDAALVFIRGDDYCAGVFLEKPNHATADGFSRVALPQRFAVHAKDGGYEWGYAIVGNQAADLALNILAMFVVPAEAFRLHQSFKAAFIHAMPKIGGRIGAEQIRTWLADQWESEQRGQYRTKPE